MQERLKSLIQSAERVVIMQADNPDGDSLGSALALEQILSDLGKEPLLYCGVDIPTYLHYLSGWDRVQKDIPKQFDVSIIVDTSAESLFHSLEKSGQRHWVAARPCIVIDHHMVENNISYATVFYNQPAVATGEIIYELVTKFQWPLNHRALTLLATSIMADSRGLTTDKTSARSIHIVAELVDKGVSIPELETARRETLQRPADLVHYKGQLLQRVEYFADNRIASISIPWEEIERYSSAYNPTMLVIEDMLLTEGTRVAIGFKRYDDGHITAKIRCNYGTPIANDLAGYFGGGGHPYASGFKIPSGKDFNDIKTECLKITLGLLEKYDKEHHSDEALQ